MRLFWIEETDTASRVGAYLGTFAAALVYGAVICLMVLPLVR